MAPSPGPRAPLSRARVIEAAVAVADERGVAAATMRNIAERLGVEAMSLYHHVPNKEAILDALVDAVVAEIALPDPALGWAPAIAGRATSARAALSRHSWALGLIESRRTAGPVTLRHHDAALGVFLTAGFTVADAVHAVSVLDSYVYGFVLQEQQLPLQDPGQAAGDLAGRLPADELPHLRQVAVASAGGTPATPDDEFRFGLDLILDGLRRHRDATAR